MIPKSKTVVNPTATRLRELFDYNPKTGDLRWRVSRGPVRGGSLAGHARQDDSRRVALVGCHVEVTHVIWAYMTGEWPTSRIHHRNAIRGDNRWNNLAEPPTWTEFADITAEHIRSLLDYNPATGAFRWKQTNGRNMTVGSPAGSISRFGYLVICISRKKYYAQRLAWLFMTGEWPSHDVDHKNGNRADNRWQNLRSATRTQNLQNQRRRSQNTSGYKGVSYDKSRNKFLAMIRANGRQINLGRFATKEEAFQRYKEAATKYFGEFARFE